MTPNRTLQRTRQKRRAAEGNVACKMTYHMLHFSDLQRQPVHEQLFAFAGAYLDSAEALCESLCSDVEHANYAHGAVVMSLAFHSIELFFKGSILQLDPGAQFGGKSGHDLDALSDRYLKLYPKKEFRFEVPFGRDIPEAVGGMAAEELAALRAYMEERIRRMPEDQRHRYPTGTDGKTWDGLFGFEPNMFLVTLRELQNDYARVRLLLNAV